MTTAVVLFVRAVMHGRGGYDAARLVGVLEEVGATGVRTHLSTGNVTLATDDVGAAVDAADGCIAAMCGGGHAVVPRTRRELTEVVAHPAFESPPAGFDRGLEVAFCGSSLPELELPVTSPRGDVTTYAATERELFSASRLVDGTTSAAGGRLERLVGLPLTSRAPGTIRRVLAALDELEA